MEDNSTKTELTPEFVTEQIQMLRDYVDVKFNECKEQVEKLLNASNSNDNKRNSQLMRVAMLIDTAMDNIHTIIGVLAEINDKLSIHDQQIWSHGNSISINKRNLNELSKYFKSADKAWAEARAVINNLAEENDKNATFRWVIGIVIGILGLILGGTAFSDSLKALWRLIFG